MSSKPLCFVLMPFGQKPDAAGKLIDFDAVYEQVIAPAVEMAGLVPIRADKEDVGGIIHKPMFERLVLCDFAVADLTTGNANVFYELGVRHAARPFSTVPIFAGTSRLPFDVEMLRAMPYTLTEQGGPDRIEETRAQLVQLLEGARQSQASDSPLFQLLQDYPNIKREKTDVFRDQVLIAEGVKERLAQARAAGQAQGKKAGQAAVAAVEATLGPLADTDTSILIDLLLSYRAVSAWADMIRLVQAMPAIVADTVLVQEQYAFALNRDQRGEDAERVLLALKEKKGPSSETLGLLGRVYKDRWDAARQTDRVRAAGLLKQALAAYLAGFEADWRDAYPGINAVTLMEVSEPPDPRRVALAPVVKYAAERRVASGKPDYWDYATLLEAAILARDEAAAGEAHGNAVAVLRERWEPETTARNLGLIREARERRGETLPWAQAIEEDLVRRSQES